MFKQPDETTMRTSEPLTRYPLLTTWNLWRHLLYPPSHPLFERTHLDYTELIATPYAAWMIPLIALGGGCGLWMLSAQATSPTLVLLFIVLVLFSSTFYVTVWIAGISVHIAKEYEHHTYDLLCLPPSGALGANWAIAAATLHRDDTLIWIDSLRKVLTGLLLIVFLLMILTIASRQHPFDGLQFLSLLLDMLALLVASYLDHIQSIVSGSLIAMLIPHHMSNRQDARFWSVTLFLMLQVSTFAVSILTLFVMEQALSVAGDVAKISASLFSLLMFYLVREGIIAVLWQALTYQLNTEPKNPFA